MIENSIITLIALATAVFILSLPWVGTGVVGLVGRILYGAWAVIVIGVTILFTYKIWS